MSFDFTQPLVLLLLAILPVFWLIDRVSRTHLPAQRRRLVLFVRMLVVALIILGLAGPRYIGQAQAAFNDVGTQRFNMDQALASYYNNVRGGQMQEDIALRNQPINEITALMSGSQATIPQFQPFQSSPVAASNIAQYINDNYKTESQAAAQTNAGIFSMIGSLAKMMPMP